MRILIELISTLESTFTWQLRHLLITNESLVMKIWAKCVKLNKKFFEL